jgi:hypothetical protein
MTLPNCEIWTYDSPDSRKKDSASEDKDARLEWQLPIPAYWKVLKKGLTLLDAPYQP